MTIAQIVRRFTALVFECWWRETITPHQVAQEIEHMLQRAITDYPREKPDDAFVRLAAQPDHR